jgi:hypothetical protein
MKAAAKRPADSSLTSLVNLKHVMSTYLMGDGCDDSHVGGPCGQSTEAGSKKYTDVTDVNRQVDGPQKIVYDTASRHQARVDSPADDTSQWIPCCGIKPVPEFLLPASDIVKWS